MPNILQVTPFMYADDFEAAVAFWRDLLGFNVVIHVPGYAYVDREDAGVRIMENGTPYRGQRPIGRPFRYYFDVTDVQALVDEFQQRLAAFPAAEVHGPVDQNYGKREYMVLAPDGGVVVFGQEIRPPQLVPGA